MRKITYLFSMFLLTLCAVGTVTAQEVKNLSELSNSAAYTITTEDRGGLVWDEAHPAQGWCSYNTTGGSTAYEVDAANPNHQWTFFKSEKGNYYLYNVGAKKFLQKKDGGTEMVEVPTSPAVGFINATGANKANYPWVVTLDGSQINLSTNQAMSVFTNWNDTADKGNMMKITKVADLTEEEVAALTEVIRTYEASIPTYVTDLANLSNTVVYTIGNGRGMFTYDPDFVGTSEKDERTRLGSTMIVSSGVAGATADLPADNLQWAILTSTSGNRYLYNVVGKVFASADTTGYSCANKDQNNAYGTNLTSMPKQPINILNGERGAAYPWVIAFGENQLSVSNSYPILGGCITFWNDLTDEGNCVRFQVVDDVTFDPTEAMAQIEAYEARVAAFNEAIELSEATLNLRGVGYPTVESEAYQTLSALIAEARANTDPTAEETAALLAAEVAYRSATEGIQMPEDGKYYYVAMQTLGGTQWLLNPTAADVAIAAMPEEVPVSATFMCRANEDGTFTFVTPQGKFFRNHSKYAGLAWMSDASTTGLSDTYTERLNNITVAKMTGDDKTDAALKDLFGLVTFYSVRGYDTGKNTDAIGYTVIKTDGSDYDGAAAQFYNAGFTSAIRMVEVNTPSHFFAASVTPAEDAEASALTTVEVTYPAAITYAGETAVTAAVGETAVEATAAVSEDDATKLVITLGAHPAGELALNIPLGAVVSTAGQPAAEAAYTFQVLETTASEAAQIVSITPDPEATLDALPTQVVVTFDKPVAEVTEAMLRTNMNFRGSDLMEYEGAVVVEGNTLTVNIPEEEISVASQMMLNVWVKDAEGNFVGNAVDYDDDAYIELTYEYQMPANQFTFAGTSLDGAEQTEPVASMVVNFNSPYDGDMVGGFDSSKVIAVCNEAGDTVTTATFDFTENFAPEALLTFAETVSAPGTYTIKVPEATVYNGWFDDMSEDFGVSSGAIYNPEFTISFTITKKYDDFTVIAADPDPAAGAVNGIEKITLQFYDVIGYDYIGYVDETKEATITNEAGDVVATCKGKSGMSLSLSRKVEFTLETPILTSGVYTFRLPEKTVWNSNYRPFNDDPTVGASYNPAYELTITVDTNVGINGIGVDGEDDKVYNVNGQLVGKSVKGLQKGVYIQNGKKIYRK